MLILVIISWLAYAVAAFFLVMTFAVQDFALVVPAVSLTVAGAALSALERIVKALEALQAGLPQTVPVSPVSSSAEGVEPLVSRPLPPPKRSLEELSADLDRLKKKSVS